MGGQSAEREVSLLGGQIVLDSLRDAGFNVIGIDAKEDLITQLQNEEPDLVFNMLHGRGGEDGTVQGLLNYLQIPFTGSDVLGSALSMDKLRSKLIWNNLGLSTANFEMLDGRSDWQSVIDRLGTVVVKPVNEGSSIGMSITPDALSLQAAFELASSYDSSVMAEQYIEGEEYTVTILQERALPAIQLRTNRVFYDYDAKYIADDTEYICPVDLPPDQLNQLNDMSLTAFNSLGCKGWGRVDVMRDEAGVFYLLEVNTVPGMTDHSLVPMAAAKAGLTFEELLIQIMFAPS